MIVMENIKNYEIRVVKSTKKDATGKVIDHNPVEPQAIADDAAGKFPKDRKYFHLQLLAGKEIVNGMMKRAQKRQITLTVFNSNDQVVLFNDIADALADEKNYTVAANGDILINRSVMVIGGKMVEEECGFVYKVMERKADGSMAQMMVNRRNPDGGYTSEGATRSIVRVFVHEEEDEDVRIAAEIQRVLPYKIAANDNTGNATIEEGTNAVNAA